MVLATKSFTLSKVKAHYFLMIYDCMSGNPCVNTVSAVFTEGLSLNTRAVKWFDEKHSIDNLQFSDSPTWCHMETSVWSESSCFCCHGFSSRKAAFFCVEHIYTQDSKEPRSQMVEFNVPKQLQVHVHCTRIVCGKSGAHINWFMELSEYKALVHRAT